MSPEDRKMYDDLFDLFTHPGWKLVIQDLERMIEPIEDIRYTNDLADLHANKGKVEVMDYLLNLPEITERSYEEANAETV